MTKYFEHTDQNLKKLKNCIIYTVIICAFVISLTFCVELIIFVGNYVFKQWNLQQYGNSGSENGNDDVMNTLAFDDPQLIKIIQERYLDPPSSADKPYILKNDSDDVFAQMNTGDRTVNQEFIFIDNITEMLFKNKTEPGFFVEGGAMDGEYLSNTFQLEKERGWTGLLIEPHQELYPQILKMNRKTYSSQSCVSNSDKTHIATLETNIKDKDFRLKVRSLIGSFIVNDKKPSDTYEGTQLYEAVQCFPLYSIIKAIGSVTHVDFMLLNINGIDHELFDNFPHDKIKVDVWIIKVINTKYLYPKESLDFTFIKRSISKGYKLFTVGAPTVMYVLVRKEFPHLKEALLKRLPKWINLEKNIDELLEKKIDFN